MGPPSFSRETEKLGGSADPQALSPERAPPLLTRAGGHSASMSGGAPAASPSVGAAGQVPFLTSSTATPSPPLPCDPLVTDPCWFHLTLAERMCPAVTGPGWRGGALRPGPTVSLLACSLPGTPGCIAHRLCSASLISSTVSLPSPHSPSLPFPIKQPTSVDFFS